MSYKLIRSPLNLKNSLFQINASEYAQARVCPLGESYLRRGREMNKISIYKSMKFFEAIGEAT